MPKPAQRPKTTPKWTGPDSVLLYRLDWQGTPIEYNNPPPNKYGKLTEVETL